MAADELSICSEFDIFAQKPVQTSLQETIETIYKPIASVDQSDLEFLVPPEHDTYIDLNIKLYVRGKLRRPARRIWTPQISLPRQISSSIRSSPSVQ